MKKMWAPEEVKKVAEEVVEESGGGGGGTNVTPNPEGTATGYLTKVGIDDTIYDVGYWEITTDSDYVKQFRLPLLSSGTVRSLSIKLDNGTGVSFGSVGATSGYTFSDLIKIDSNALVSLTRIASLEFNTGSIIRLQNSAGTAGQVLGKNSSNALAWITPSTGMYIHNIYMRGVYSTYGDYHLFFTLITRNNSPYTYTDLLEYLTDIMSTNDMIMASGDIPDSSTTNRIITAIGISGGKIQILGVNLAKTRNAFEISSEPQQIQDMVLSL